MSNNDDGRDLTLSKQITLVTEMLHQLLNGEVPELRAEVRQAREASLEASSQVHVVCAQIESISSRVQGLEHEAREQRAARLNGVSTKTRLEGLEKKLERKESRGWGIWTLIIGSILALLTTSGSALWYVRGMDKDLEQVQDRIELHHPSDKTSRNSN